MSDQTLSAYANSLFPIEDDLLRQFKEEAAAEGLPEIQVPEEAGRFLQLMIALGGAKHILEIGTLFGYSTVVMARALADEGRIVTMEYEPKHADVALRNFKRAGLADKIDLRVGAALENLPSLSNEKFDLVFIDADKRTYPRYLEWALKLTDVGSLILADNVWRNGAVLNPVGDDSDKDTRAATIQAELQNIDTQGLASFNQAIAGNPRLFSTFVPTREAGDALSVSVVQ
jgi:predicted O-methyltransferase YrrM